MMKIDSNKGITLAILIVVVIVVIIILGISINMGIDSINDSTDEQFRSELYIVQQAVFQKQIEYQAKGDEEVIGNKILDFSNYVEFKNAYKKINKEDFNADQKIYYLLNKEDLEDLGLSGKRVDESEFIVNYETGEVYNNTKKYYSNGVVPMYLPGYDKDEITGENKSNKIEIVENT